MTTHSPSMTRLTDLAELLHASIGQQYDRTITHTVDLHTTGDGVTQLQLVISHSPDTKAIIARLNVVLVVDRGTYTVTKSRPLDARYGRRLPPRPVARYSIAALMAHRTDTIALLLEDPSWMEDLDLGPMPEHD